MVFFPTAAAVAGVATTNITVELGIGVPVEGAYVLNQLIHRHVIAGSCMYMYTLCTPQQPSASAAGPSSRSPDPGEVRRERLHPTRSAGPPAR